MRLAIVAPASVLIALTVGVTTVVGILVLVLGAVATITALVGYCPIYDLFGAAPVSSER